MAEDKKKGSDNMMKSIAGLVVVLLVIGGGYYWYSHRAPSADQQQAQQAAQQADTLKQLGKLMIIPDGETPLFFAITDPDQLIKQQAFFKGSVAGDQLILFPVSQKAVIYSPSRNIIVNTGPIQREGQPGVVPPTSAATTPTPTATPAKK